MKRILYLVRQTAYTIFSFCYFIGLAVELTVRGFFLLTLGGKTDENKLKYHRILQRKAYQYPPRDFPEAVGHHQQPSVTSRSDGHHDADTQTDYTDEELGLA